MGNTEQNSTAADDRVRRSKASNGGGSKRIPWLRSVSYKIFQLAVLAVLLVTVCLIVATTILSRTEMKNTIANYMQDQAVMGRDIMNTAIDLDADKAYNYYYMNEMFAKTQVSGLSSSYVYIVEAGGNMLYHKDKEKVGQPVVNEVIKAVAEDLANGREVSDKFVSYKYNGIMKYAAYSVTKDNRSIVIVTADESDALSSINSIAKKTSIGAAIVFVIVAAISFIVGKLISNPIAKIAESISRLSDLDLRPDESTEKLARLKDEIGLMARATRNVSAKLREVISEIREQSGSLYDTSVTLTGNATDTVSSLHQVEIAVSEVAEGATSQAHETSDATANIISMGDMIESSNQEVNRLKTSSGAIDEAVRKANAILNELLAINAQAGEAIEMIRGRINTTNESVEDIKSATVIITSIAEETNLLSLNASIEAARAGEQGRGFAVVASQIQKLAEQSNESAKKIEDITLMLIDDSNKSVAGINEVKDIMDKQSGHVRDTGRAFEHVKQNIDESIRGINELISITAQLDSARGAVTDTVQNLSAIAQENAASSQESSASVTEVGNVMDQVIPALESLKEISKAIDSDLRQFIIE
ncbi:MAG: methyl-accepting chemotaxis protein [Bacteroidales bacterium]|nr:methyl-accepting chemotaxis protein [Bacteroidales bacterium]